MTATEPSVSPVLLGGYAAKRCPVRAQYDALPLVRTQEVPSAEDQARIDAGIAFEANVFARLLALNPGAVLIDRQLRRAAAVAATVEAMDSGAPLVLGGWLPDDPAGGRTGRPDLLIAVDGGYLPGDVKHHRSAQPSQRTAVEVSTLGDPAARRAVPGWSAATPHRYGDGIQLAHYWRMLGACGRAPRGRAWAAVLGSTVLDLSGGGGDEDELVFVWHDLEAPGAFTFSRSQGKARRSLLQRYDHEHVFRVKVAQTARRVGGAGDDPQLLVAPVGQPECRRCPYEQFCADKMGPEDPSAAINVGGLDTREWLALRQLGVDTTAELAALDPDDDEFADAYYLEVSHRTRTGARRRLRDVIERAAMIVAGIDIARTRPGPVPVADVEIDLDVEWDTDQFVYLWGARVRHGTDDTTGRYHHFADWSATNTDSEYRLAVEVAEWLRSQIAAANRAGGTLLVFHWSSPERVQLQRILGASAVADLIDPECGGVFVDLEQFFKRHFVAVHGSSIKQVAPRYGFRWRVEDPGGAISQTHLAQLRESDDEVEADKAKSWLLSYNEDDCAAMAAIRDGIRRTDTVGDG
ncbi:MAG: ribonuclease H-like domain-containing protein [Actinomycetia bacterium]|nr:ribonuclease H-like domain-containing protein [Actinomycetes bacterium]